MTDTFKTTTKSFATKSFTEVLGENLSTPPPPLLKNKIKGIGATDTHLCAKGMMALFDNKYFAGMNYANQKRGFEISNQYTSDDHKSRAGERYQQERYVTVTRETFAPSHELKTPYHNVIGLFKHLLCPHKFP